MIRLMFVVSLCSILALSAKLSSESGLESSNTDGNFQVKLKVETEKLLSRKKRKFIDHNVFSYAKWPRQILYYIDTAFSNEHREYIRKVIREDFEAKTCLQFTELQEPTNTTAHFMWFIKAEEVACSAYIGRLNVTKYQPGQPILLHDICFILKEDILFGVARSLGMIFEVDRPDRDNYITVLWQNILPEDQDYLSKWSDTQIDYWDVPYDYGSVMHHGAQVILKPTYQLQYDYPDVNDDKSYSIIPNDVKLLRVMGQVSELSFYDAMAINKVYCADMCTHSLQCLNRGYQDPNDCTKCLCPDGYSGDQCNVLDEHVTNTLYPCTPESGIVTVTEDQQCVSSPGYGREGYTTGDKCSWLLRAPELKTFEMWFTTSTFDVRNIDYECEHWVEIKYKGLSFTRGPRFCSMNYGMQDPLLPTIDSKLQSQSSDVLVIFKSPTARLAEVDDPESLGGFELCFSLSVDAKDEEHGGGGLSTGIIVLIVLLVVVVLAFGIILAVVLCRRKGKCQCSASAPKTRTESRIQTESTSRTEDTLEMNNRNQNIISERTQTSFFANTGRPEATNKQNNKNQNISSANTQDSIATPDADILQKLYELPPDVVNNLKYALEKDNNP